MFPNQDIEPKKFAAVCWTVLLSSLGDLLLVLLWGSREMEEVDDEARTVLIDLWLVTKGARGSNWNLEEVAELAT